MRIVPPSIRALWVWTGLALLLLTGCTSDPPRESAGPTTTASSTTTAHIEPVSSTTSPPTEASAASTTTTAPHNPVAVLGPESIAEAFSRVEGWPTVRATAVLDNAITDATGEIVNGERVTTEEYWENNVTVGSVTFKGLATLLTARTAGNIDLATELALGGSQYIHDKAWLYLPRRIAHTLHDEINEEGTPWVAIQIEGLDDAAHFALRLIAPFTSTRLDPDSQEQFTATLTDVIGDYATYQAQIDDIAVTIRIDRSGALRSILSLASDSRLGAQRFELTYDPITANRPDPPDVRDSEDITERFNEYVRLRYEAAPQTLNG